MNEEQNIAIEGVLKLYTASMLNDIKKDPLKAVNKMQENLAEILKLKKEKDNLQNRIDKAYEQLQLLHYNFPDYDEIHHRIQDIEDILKESGE